MLATKSKIAMQIDGFITEEELHESKKVSNRILIGRFDIIAEMTSVYSRRTRVDASLTRNSMWPIASAYIFRPTG